MTTLPSLATIDDLSDALQAPVDAGPAALALRRASARVRRYARQTFTLVEGDMIVLPGGDRTIRMPERPLVVDDEHPLTVTELADLGGVEIICLENRDYIRLGDELTRGYPWYAPGRLMGWPRRNLGVWAPRVRIGYSHGYAVVPDDVVDIVLDLAAMSLTNPQALREEAVDDYRRTFAAETIGGAALSEDHKAALAPFMSSVTSVRLM